MLLDYVNAYAQDPNNPDRDKRSKGKTTPLPDPNAPGDVSGGGRHQSDGSGGGGDAPAFDYQTPAYQGPLSPSMSFWHAPPQFNAPQFTAPDAVTALNDPGYQFRLSQGEQALQQSAAGQGMLRTGGTLKDILGYGQNLASQEYQNVYNRALQTFGTKYQGAKDMYAPNLLGWQTQMGFGQQDAMAAFQRQWDMYTFGLQNELAHEQLVAGLAESAPPA
jgi:hypothetical protein